MNLIIENQSFTCVNLFKDLIDFKTKALVLDQSIKYHKGSFLNRYTIVGANGSQALSIPLLGGRHQEKPFKEVKICNTEPWQLKHWRAIKFAYNRSPWFEYYRDSLKKLFTTPYTFLYDFNQVSLEWCLQQLKQEITLQSTIDSKIEYPKTEFLDRRGVYFSTKTWFDPCTLTYKQYKIPELIKYTQVFESKIGFIYNASILDLLFCEGPNAFTILNAR